MKKKLTKEQLELKFDINKDGVISRKSDGFIYTQTENNHGYLTSAGEYIHRLVAIKYIDNPDNLPCVNHIDGNKHNNTIGNLEWCSYSYNSKHAVRTGLQHINKGCSHYTTKLTIEQLQTIINLSVSGMYQKDIALKFKISKSTVSRIINGVRYKEEPLDRSKVK